MNLQNKLALVTGGSSGIGLATAKALARKGARVWMMARDKKKLEQALVEVKTVDPGDGNHGILSVDVSDWNEVQSAIKRLKKEAGVPDLIVHSAGMTHPGYFQDLDMEIFQKNMDVNYFGSLYVTKALVNDMIARKSGHIVFISSLAGLLGVYGYTAYGASKFALRGLSDTLRMELKPHGVGVSIVFPPDTDTPQHDYEKPFLPEETKAISGNAKLVSPDAVAQNILKGVQRNNYMIFCGGDGRTIYLLTRLLGGWTNPVMDMIVAGAQKKKVSQAG